ncbi:single-stranded-DNA-specific exonuclease RecJ [Moraxella sp. ZY210820]|uniref:single-stranded-DNA-specific exonuclease RecJ n=1 Tax=unclassified Moraxella TaxID=2685852 RepID=UPI00272EF586|nr:single-stranded-DNA-specific exonuclease RecJ [Moraxella sp. ZY210820]WLF83814.1 single-stranded-DNA-specific exonuclease RecJ [Moraxella sp. ZY210820]
MMSLQVQTRPFLTDPISFPHLSPFMARVMARRGLSSEQELELKLQHLLKPNLKGLTQAVEYIDQAIDLHKKIIIIGDYDADGATSTALMILALRALGANVEYLVPDRFKYGYGLTPAIADLAYQQFQPDVLITVDNGISSHAGVEQAQKLGMQVIITDHHLTTKATPQAEAVVNPNQLGCEFASKNLAGVGVAFYVLASLMTHRAKQQKSNVKMSQYLDLVALGTYADVAQLDYNNRILIDAGVKKIRQKQCRLGILAILEVAKRQAELLQAQDFGFSIGPRLNAAGRMDNMQIGVECLLAEDWQTAYSLAERLNQLNLERRQVETKMKQQVLEELQHIEIQHHNLPSALVMFEEHFHQGVIGIVAGRLKDKFHRPSIVFAPDINPQYIKGSARSIDGIHIRDMIERVAEQYPHLVCFFGGHSAAAGLTIEKQYFNEFKRVFCELISQCDDELFSAKLWTDGELSIDEFNLSTVEQIQYYAPWGHKFPSPVFEGKFYVMDYRWLKETHLKLFLTTSTGQSLQAIAFNAKDKWYFDPQSTHVFLVYELDKNEFNGQVELQLKVNYLKSV